jgi:integrase
LATALGGTFFLVFTAVSALYKPAKAGIKPGVCPVAVLGLLRGGPNVAKHKTKTRKEKLTTLRVANRLKEPGRYRDTEVKGLLLCVASETSASWVLRFQLRGVEYMHGLGSAREFSIKAARERALTARRLLADGINPLSKKRERVAAEALAAAKILSFRSAAQQYYEQHAPGWTNEKHRSQFLSSMKRYVNPIIGDVAVSDIDTALVLRVLEQPVKADKSFDLPAGNLWAARPSTAGRVRNRIEQILAWATVRKFRTGDNPARWKGYLSEALPERGKAAAVVHFAAMPFAEMPSFMAALRKRDGVAARALEFLILTGARTAEVTGMSWNEIDLQTKVWTVPASRMKGGKEHRVPLAPRALAILQEAFATKGDSEYVFTGPDGGALSKSALPVTFARLGRTETVHGLRSSFRDWASERSSFQPYVVEMCLAHSVGGAVEKAYRRGDVMQKRRAVMESWATYCQSKPIRTDNVVVPLRA